jgi:phytoene dehydrogenase-like protein
VLVLEAGDGVGGRVRTDIVDGFVLDRGFQVLLTAYPEARRMLDYETLDLRAYKAGALVQIDGQRHVVADPFRNPMSLLATFKAPIGSLIDKARIAWLRRDVMGPSIDALWSRPETTTGERLRAAKFSDEIIDRFFRPLFAGIQLDPSLLTSSRMFDFVFRMLASGDSAVPARGMQAIPDQLAARLPAGTIRLRSAVASIDSGVVTLVDGSVVRASNAVVATDGPAAAGLVGSGLSAPASNSVTCLYFAADAAPFDERMILLNGEGAAGGPVNNVCVPSLLSGTVAPAGAHLVSASVVGSAASLNDVELLDAARAQLRNWFGSAVDGWRHLRTYRIHHAQPAQVPPALSPVQRPVKLHDGLYVCGDHRDSASIHGALLSGRRAADAIVTG